MNNIYKRIVFTAGFLFLFLGAQAQSALEDVANALRSGNVSAMANYFDNIVPITINGSQSTYSRTQAEMVLKDFMRTNVPKELTIVSSGNSNNARFAIGDLTTSTGKYSVYILLKQKDHSYYLQELRLNK